MNKTIKILIVILILLIISIISFFSFVFYQHYSSNSPSSKQEIKQLDSSQKFSYEFNDIILNTTNNYGRIKLMKLSFTIQSFDDDLTNYADNLKPDLIDSLIKSLSSKSSNELLTLQGKALLKEEIISSFNTIIQNNSFLFDKIPSQPIHKLFFTSFVIK